MSRAHTSILAIMIFSVVVQSPTLADQPTVIEKARRHLEAGEARLAMELFESALPAATNETRPDILNGLREAYRQALRQADDEGNTSSAALYREHLAILERGSRREEPKGENNQDRPAPPSAEPHYQQPAPPEPPRSLEGEEEVQAAAPQPQPDEAEPQAVEELPAVGSDVAQAPASNEPAQAADPSSITAAIERADAAFLAKRYHEAGQIYGDLAKSNALPEIRHDPWAYCRMTEVVQRINAQPGSAQEWAWIRQEILEIRRLSPRNWYSEYLRNLVEELSARSRPANSGRTILRGASPNSEDADRPPSSTPRPTPRPPAAGGPTGAGSQSGPLGHDMVETVGRPGEPVDSWMTWETANFRIFHQDEALARQVAPVAEQVRSLQLERWSKAPGAVTVAWNPRCDIYLYPSAESFQRMTGQPAESPGFSTMALNSGKVTVRRVNLRGDHENLIQAILPHEITHVVLADLFPSMQIPRWADEGIAVLAEPQSEQDLRAGDLTEPLRSGRLFRLSDLMSMDYPEAQHWSLYYAQSVSLTRFLVELGSAHQFVQFVQNAQTEGPELALRNVYDISGFDELELRWQQHARSNSTELASGRQEDATSPSSEATRTR